MSGTGTAAAAAILMLGLVTGLILAHPSLERASQELRSAREEYSDLTLSTLNSGPKIASTVFNNTSAVLNITITNDGAEVTDLDEMDILLNGTLMTWTPTERYLFPDRDAVVSFSNITDPRSVMIVDRFGLMDHTEEILIIT